MDAPYDAIVVGSGATGGWAAKELTEAGLSVALLEAGLPVGAFPYDGYWLDIGRHDDYQQALADYEEILPRLLPG